MKPSELFSVVVRIIGLLLLMYALSQIAMALLNLIGGGPGNVFAMLVAAVPSFLVGLWFLRGAKALVDFAFRDEDKELNT